MTASGPVASVGGSLRPDPGGRPARRRVVLGLVDQALSSVTNFGATIVAAKEMPPTQVGHYTITNVTYVLIVVLARGAFSEPVLVRFSATRGVSALAEIRAVAGIVLLAGILLGAVIATGGGLALTPGLRGPFLVLAALLPALLLQDFLRFVAFTLGTPAKAVAMDVTWLVLQLGAVLLVKFRFEWTETTAVLTWLVPGAVSVLVGVWLLRVVPRPRGGIVWLRAQGTMGIRFAADGLIAQGAGQLVAITLSVVASAAQVAYYGVARTVFGPLVLFFAGVRFIVVPELIQLRDRDSRSFMRLAVGWSLGLVVAAVVWGLVAWAVPLDIGRYFFGASWRGAHRLLIPTLLITAAGAAGTGAFAGIRAYADAKGGLVARVLSGGANLVAGSIGAVVGGAMGASVGMAIVGAPGAATWWWQFGRSRRAGAPATPAVVPPHVDEPAMGGGVGL
jgi:O-antigen/teichoic acid export membrane protein